MSETREPNDGGHSHSPAPTPAAGSPSAALPYGRPDDVYGPSSSSPMLRLGGALGIAACVIGLLTFILACMGLGKVVVLSLIPVGLSAAGLALSLLGAIKDKDSISEDTHVLHALFANIAGLIGGLLLMAVWLRWPNFPR